MKGNSSTVSKENNESTTSSSGTEASEEDGEGARETKADLKPKLKANTWAIHSDTMTSELSLGNQLGSNPGGTLTNEGGAKSYVKYPVPNNPANRDKLWGEALACKVYKDLGVDVPDVSLVSTGEEIRLESEFVQGWKKLEDNPKILEILLSNDAKIATAKIRELYENYPIDAWLNAWDVVGLTYDNIGYVRENGQYRFVRIDTGGAFNFRAMQSGTKTSAYGSDAFSNQVHALKTMLQVSRNQEVFARMELRHFYKGIDKLEKYPDKKLYQWIVNSGIGYKNQRIDLFMKMLVRKKNVMHYAAWLKTQNCPVTKPFIEVIHDATLGWDAFLSSDDTSLVLYNKDLTKNSSMEEIAWDVVSNHYLESADGSYDRLYKKFATSRPEFPIKRVKHGGMHVVRTALAIEVITQLRREAGDSISDEEMKMLQIAALFHDAGRKKDIGKDKEEWEKDGEILCKAYLIHLGFDSVRSAEIASTISQKDAKNRSLYQQILHDADCLDVLRSHKWLFNAKYLDIFNSKEVSQKKLDSLCTNYRIAVEQMEDAGREWKDRAKVFSLEKKRFFEHNPNIYSKIRTLFVKNGLIVK